MEGFVASEVFNDDGSFTDTGRGTLAGYAGDDHKGTKVFEDVKDLAGLCKFAADTKSAYNKKMENVIQIPGEGSDETTMAAYRARLAEASGVPSEASGYEIFKPEKLPDGMEHNEELEAGYRKIFKETGCTKATALALSKFFTENQITGFNSVMEEDRKEAAEKADKSQREFDEGCNKFRTENPGEKLADYCRTSLKAINEFGDAELKDKLKTAGMYENATDLAKWRDNGVPLPTLSLFKRIGDAMKDTGGPLGEGGGGDLTPKQKARKLYNKTDFDK